MRDVPLSRILCYPLVTGQLLVLVCVVAVAVVLPGHLAFLVLLYLEPHVKGSVTWELNAPQSEKKAKAVCFSNQQATSQKRTGVIR